MFFLPHVYIFILYFRYAKHGRVLINSFPAIIILFKLIIYLSPSCPKICLIDDLGAIYYFIPQTEDIMLLRCFQNTVFVEDIFIRYFWRFFIGNLFFAEKPKRLPFFCSNTLCEHELLNPLANDVLRNGTRYARAANGM